MSQAFLALDTSLYPQGLVTGYFGSLTKAAVARFQTRNGISAVGRVGPATLPVLNAQMGNTGTNQSIAPTISNMNISLGSNNATVSYNTNIAARGTVYYSSSPLNVYETLNDVVVTGANVASTDTNLSNSKAITLSGLQSNTTYFYMVYTTNAAGNVTVSVPSSFRTNN